MNVWIIQAFQNKKELPGGGFGIDDFVEVTVEAETEELALKRAEEMIKRNHYRVAKVWERSPHMDNHEEMQRLQLETQIKMLNLLKGK